MNLSGIPRGIILRSVALVFCVLCLVGSGEAITYPAIDSTFLSGTTSTSILWNGKTVSKTWGYRYLAPKPYNASASPQTKYPVIIFLHGAGERGSDNQAQLTASNNSGNGALSLVATANPDNRTNYPCFFVAPQCPTGTDWSQQSGADVALTNIINFLKATYPNAVDEDRICLTGLSLGAFGTWNLPSTALPNTFSCIVPVSGGGSNMETFPYGLPVWAFHAVDDGNVKIDTMDTTITNIRYRGQKALFTRYASGDHSDTTWKAAYQTPLLLPWIFAQKRGQPMQGSPNIMISGSTRDTKLNLVGTATAGGSFTRVGWSSSNVNGTLAKTDGVVSGTTLTSAASTFTSAFVGYRIGITLSTGSKVFYNVTGFVDSHTLTLDKAPGDQTGASFTSYPPGNDENPYAGTGISPTWTLSNIPLTFGSNLVQAWAEASSYSNLGGNTTINDSIAVGYIAPTGDTTAPAVQIDNPTTNATFATSSPLALSGTASDANGLISIKWATDLGFSGTAAGLNTWTIEDVPLVAGDNKITVTAKDAMNNTSTAVLNVTYSGVSANQPPSVVAGSYQSITWPSYSAALSGTVSDDGLPLNSAVTSNWSKISGPGTVTFASSSSPATTATFSQPGTYVLRLTASDAVLTASSDVSVTVRPSGTFAAAIECGNTSSYTSSSEGVVYSADTISTGVVSSTTSAIDGTLDPVVFQKLRAGSSSSPGLAYAIPVPSGTYDVMLQFTDFANIVLVPGMRTINVAAEGQQLVSNLDVFNQVGHFAAYEHLLRVKVTDGTLNLNLTGVIGYPMISGLVIRSATATPFESWQQTQFGSDASNPAVSDMMADPDGDGMCNLLEYAFNRNPNSATSATPPVIGQQSVSQNDYLTLTFRRRTTAPLDLVYTVESSSDLISWSPESNLAVPPVSNGDGTESVTIRDSQPLNENTHRFLRLRVN